MNHSNIVNTSVDYDHTRLEANIESLKSKYPFFQTGVIGKSVLGKNLSYIRLGSGPNEVFFNGAHHSLEWITSVLLMKFVEDYCRSYENNEELETYNIREVFDQTSIYIVPMVNPDGVDLVLNGIESIPSKHHENLKKWKKNKDSFSESWQANIRGVDLNHNYDASWNNYKSSQLKNNILGPAHTRYSGKCPESEPETAALTGFTRERDFSLVLALHSQGKEIYWDYNDMSLDYCRDIGNELSRVSGYSLETPTVMASNTGYKDWFIKIFNKPGFTIEVGRGRNPLPISEFDSIYKEVLPLLLKASVSTLKIL